MSDVHCIMSNHFAWNTLADRKTINISQRRKHFQLEVIPQQSIRKGSVFRYLTSCDWLCKVETQKTSRTQQKIVEQKINNWNIKIFQYLKYSNDVLKPFFNQRNLT